MLSTADITTEGFGFMLCYGDLVWVPFTYSLQARFLSFVTVRLPPWAVAAIVAIFVAGFAIFRLSNLEKDRFRRNPEAPEVAYLETIPTRTGSRLIVSGWWGLARHINYFGEMLMALGIALPAALATGSWLPSSAAASPSTTGCPARSRTRSSAARRPRRCVACRSCPPLRGWRCPRRRQRQLQQPPPNRPRRQ